MRKLIKLSVFLLVAACSLLMGSSKDYKVGSKGPGGGIIFYVSKAGFTVKGYGIAHYLEAAPADVGGFEWGGHQTLVGGTGTSIGSGRNNTDRILAKVPDAPAAKACKDYRGGGKTDWFLPSKDELNVLYSQKKLNVVIGFGNCNYWSSSEKDSYSAWGQYFGDGDQAYTPKDYCYDEGYSCSVRAVRAF